MQLGAGVRGGLDTAHFSYLHAGIRGGEKVGLHETASSRSHNPGDNEPPSVARFRWLIEDGRPQFSVLEHDAGLLLCAARHADDGQLYWRMTQFLMPNHSLAPGNFAEDNNLGNTWVPIDDVSCWIFCYCWNPDRPLTQKETERFNRGWGVFSEVDADYVPIRRRENDYLIDRTLQREVSFTGIRGISEQDQAIADSQGLIADRTRELLGQTDLGVVRFRNLALAAASDVAAGKTPKGVDRPRRLPGAFRRYRSPGGRKPPRRHQVAVRHDVGGCRFVVLARQREGLTTETRVKETDRRSLNRADRTNRASLPPIRCLGSVRGAEHKPPGRSCRAPASSGRRGAWANTRRCRVRGTRGSSR